MADRGIVTRGIGCWIRRREKITGLGKTSLLLSTTMLMRPRYQPDEAQSYTGSITKSGDEAKRWQVENSPDEGYASLLRRFEERWHGVESDCSVSPTV